MPRSSDPGGSAAYPLAWVYLGLVAYASLYPFTGWRWPGQVSVGQVFTLPFPPWRDNLDLAVNVLGYIPLGLLLFVVGIRLQQRPLGSGLVACGLAAGVSYGMEVTQQFLPGRYPSALDWITNSCGAVLGVAIAAGLHACDGLLRWQDWRDRWFSHRSGGALTLLLTWPLGLLFPLPFPLGVGPAWGRLQDALLEASLQWNSTPAWIEKWADEATSPRALSPAAEVVGTALGVIGPCLLAFSVTRAGWRRVAVLCVFILVGVFTTTLSAAVNFGPTHAFAWLTPSMPWALGAAAVVSLLSVPLPQRWAAGLALVTLSALLVLVAEAPADPFYALSLQAWEQGRFIHFHGFAQWIGWLWPFAALAWLMSRVAEGDRSAPPRGQKTAGRGKR